MIVFFNQIDNLCTQTKNLTSLETVIDVMCKNLLPSYQEQLAVAEALADLGSGSTENWDYQRLWSYFVTWKQSRLLDVKGD